MKNIFKDKVLFIGGIILIIVIVVIVILTIKVGNAYKSKLSDTTTQAPLPITHTEKDAITKVSITNNNDNSCIEITPDGAIRVYSECGTKLVTAHRTTDIRYTAKLYKTLYEMPESESQTQSTIDNCEGYIITIETENNTRKVCITKDSQNGGDTSQNSFQQTINNDIIDTIDKIIEDIPPTPTVTSSPNQPTSTLSPSSTVNPSQPMIPTVIPTPTVTSAPQKPFTCDFLDVNGKKRPKNVSNVICSTDPIVK